jgi:hypothetical protein
VTDDASSTAAPSGADGVVNADLTMRYGSVDPEYAERLASTPPDQDGPVWMVNLMRYRERAEYADGRATDLTGQQADDLYAPFDSLAAVGAEIVFFGEVETQLLGDGPAWDRIAVVKYPTGRAFVDMQMRPEFVEHHVHKDAGMAATIITGTRPFAHPEGPADAPELDQVPFPSTPEDPRIVVVHVVAFDREQASVDESIESMTAYTQHAIDVAVPHGVRVEGWFRCDGTVVGDGRHWDQVRFNSFPSREAFMTVVMDPDRLAAQHEFREPAMSDTYTMIVRPLIDGLAASWADEEVSAP